jgi:proteic killer suppression protein
LNELLTALHAASGPQDLGAPSYRLHRLKGDSDGAWSVRVNGNWRVTFRFEGEDAVLIDYQDYH